MSPFRLPFAPRLLTALLVIVPLEWGLYYFGPSKLFLALHVCVLLWLFFLLWRETKLGFHLVFWPWVLFLGFLVIQVTKLYGTPLGHIGPSLLDELAGVILLLIIRWCFLVYSFISIALTLRAKGNVAPAYVLFSLIVTMYMGVALLPHRIQALPMRIVCTHPEFWSRVFEEEEQWMIERCAWREARDECKPALCESIKRRRGECEEKAAGCFKRRKNKYVVPGTDA